jgi:hypothetical protein
MSLCETLHGRRKWPELEHHGPAMGSSPERGKRGKEEGSRGRCWECGLGRGRAVGGAPWGLGAAASVRSAAVREKIGGRRREEKKREGRKRKEKKYGKFSKLEKFWGEK